jgi:hypothetical protein
MDLPADPPVACDTGKNFGILGLSAAIFGQNSTPVLILTLLGIGRCRCDPLQEAKFRTGRIEGMQPYPLVSGSAKMHPINHNTLMYSLFR